ncbi:MAG: peroxiredoxin [Candidatus Kapabacteria bacterium]|nr:peroxiredoxin [Candidatus Kapabacteria bacterium]
MALLVGNKAPVFQGIAVIGGDATSFSPDNAFKNISLADYNGKWVVFFFYPLDFTFVCPTEIEEFGKNYEAFKNLNCEVVACSTDSHFSHLAWRSSHPGLRNLPFPMLADFKGDNAKSYDIYKEETGYALRGLYIIDPEGELKYSVVHPEAVGRNSAEVLRVLSALQTGKLTPCNWEAGQNTLN